MLIIDRNTETGLLHAKIMPENKLLEDFLQTEIQQDITLIHLLKQKTFDPHALPFEITGNAHSLTLTKDEYLISSLYGGEHCCRGPLTEFMDILQQWAYFLENE
ncbi:MAG: hypothetical protein COB93_06670 [Sneathiella sp.]|nr:MAG: hypothetical protein COB93_06670 [Sneathiella sp.]